MGIRDWFWKLSKKTRIKPPKPYRPPEKKKMVLAIKRIDTDDQGTDGILYTQGFCCYTLELPWRDNKPFLSCIKSGLYTAGVDNTTIIGGLPVIRFSDDQFNGERTGILIHVGNFAGDQKLSYKSDVLGCIEVGMAKGELNNQKAVLKSHDAMTELLAVVGEGIIAISIENIYEV